MDSATILAVAGTTAATVQSFGFPRLAGGIMLAGNVVVIVRGLIRRWASRRASDSPHAPT